MKQEYMFSQQPWVMLISFLKIIQMYLTFISRRLFHAIFMFKKFWQQIKVIIGLKFSSLIWIQIFLKLCSGKLCSYRMKYRRWDMFDISVRKEINIKYTFNFVRNKEIYSRVIRYHLPSDLWYISIFVRNAQYHDVFDIYYINCKTHEGHNKSI